MIIWSISTQILGLNSPPNGLYNDKIIGPYLRLRDSVNIVLNIILL